MKFPSLLRTPNYQRFKIEPRYYDPVKEDIDRRTRIIKKELESGRQFSSGEGIRGSFSRKSKFEYDKSSYLRIILMVFFFVIIFGYLEFGNAIFHIFWLVIPVYLFFKFKSNTPSSN
ncbi:MAG: hypothetical protein AAF363_11350 [Bacteroidota bacterium]